MEMDMGCIALWCIICTPNPHHGLEHAGPDCSSGDVPPTTPGGHRYGNAASSAPVLSSKVSP
eukprot:450457-Prymnesium_polylepis.2